MTEEMVIDVVREAFWNVLLVVGPILIVSLGIGLAISIFQAATSISEQTLSFVPKLIGVLLVTALVLPFIIGTLTDFTRQIFDLIATM
ncbi:MAG: flagellar biosynthesis protein FliQ [Candidatus Kapaibacteriales bacterium]